MKHTISDKGVVLTEHDVTVSVSDEGIIKYRNTSNIIESKFVADFIADTKIE